MSADEISIKITARDEFSARAKDAGKAANALEKEIGEAKRALNETGKGAAEIKVMEQRLVELRGEWRRNSQAARQLTGDIRKVGDTGATSAKKATTAWQKFQKVMGNPLVTAVSTIAITMFARDSIRAFAEVEDATDALSASFGASGDTMIAWANESAIAFNLSRGEALKSAQMMAVYGDAAGLAGEELESFAITLTERAAEAASYFGGTTADATAAFGAALRGEMEPARRFGILLDDMTLRTRAFEMGLISTTSQALTPQQKTLSSYNLIMEQTTRVQGDVARTADSMGNQIKQSQAQMENLKAAVGESLAIALGPLLGMLNGALEAFNALPGPIKTMATAIGAVGAAVLIVGPRLAMMGVTLDGVKAKTIGATHAMVGMRNGMMRAGLAIAAYSAAMMAAGQANGGTGIVLGRVDNLNDALRQMTADGGLEGYVKKFKNFDAAVGDFVSGGNFDTRMKQSARMLAELDAELATMVASGKAGIAERQFNALADSAESWGGSVDEVRRVLPNYTSTLEGATAASERHSAAADRVAPILRAVISATERTTRATGYTADGMERSAEATRNANSAFREGATAADRDAAGLMRAATGARQLRDAKREAAAASDALTGALDGVTAAIQRAEAMRAYNDAMKAYVEAPSIETAEAVSSAMVAAGNSMDNPRKKAKFVSGAVKDIKTAADGVGLSPDLENALNRADTEAKNVKTSIDAIPESKRIKIYIETIGRIPGLATGGMIDHSPLAAPRARGLLSGPGSGTSDSIPARLSRGEFVVRAAAVKAIGVGNMYALNRADSRPVYVAPKMTAPTLTNGPVAPVQAGPTIGEVVINHPSSGIDVQAEVLWAMRRAERLQRERA